MRGALIVCAATIVLASVSHGCYTPQVILEGGVSTLRLSTFPVGTESVEVDVAPDVSLRGVFVPASAGAPVVLCFLESMGSITYGSRPAGRLSSYRYPAAEPGVPVTPPDDYPAQVISPPDRHQYQVLARLQALGFASLVLDYEGVGTSGGERASANLRRDARAAWDEAVRRAGGDPGRVLLRGCSIGALAAAMLLEDGARPAAVTLIAPVRAETVVPNIARLRYGSVLAFLARAFVRDPVDVDLLALLDELELPLLVVSPLADGLLPPDEQDELRQVVQRSDGVFLIRERDHDVLAGAARDLLPAEVAFYERRLPDMLPDRERAALDVWERAAGANGWRGLPASAFDEGTPLRARMRSMLQRFALPGAGLPVALALSEPSDNEAERLAQWLVWLPRELFASAELDVLCALVALDDPAGRLNCELLTDTLSNSSILVDLSLDALLARYGESFDSQGGIGAGVSISLESGHIAVYGLEQWLNATLAAERGRLTQTAGLSEAAADRQALRLFLRIAGVPERLTTTGAIEVWRDGTWTPLPPLPLRADAAAADPGD